LDDEGTGEVPPALGGAAAEQGAKLLLESRDESLEPLEVFSAEVDQVPVRHIDGTHTHGLRPLHLAQQAPADLGGLNRGAESLGEEPVDDSLQPAFKLVEEPQGSSKTSRQRVSTRGEYTRAPLGPSLRAALGRPWGGRRSLPG